MKGLALGLIVLGLCGMAYLGLFSVEESTSTMTHFSHASRPVQILPFATVVALVNGIALMALATGREIDPPHSETKTPSYT